LASISKARESYYRDRWGRGVLGEGCPRWCRARPELGERSNAECGLRAQEMPWQNGEIGCRGSGGACARER
jgi:hypothetical protein